MKYTDPALTIEEQLILLKKKNLVVHNEDAVESILLSVGYFRLNMYMKYFRSGNNFRDNTSIETVDALYQFDKALRFYLFKAIADIEVALRALLNNSLACRYGPHWIMNNAIFKEDYHAEHNELIAEVTKYCTNKPEEQFIKQYRKQYTDPGLPPSWMIMEVLSFGKVSRIYEGILLTEDRVKISRPLNTHDNILTSWLHCFTYIRNLCAHHAKILNRVLTIKPIMPSKKSNRFLLDFEELDVSKIYAVLCCIQYLLNTINTSSDFKRNIIQLIDGNHIIDPLSLGFTRNWKEENIWQL